MRRRRRFSSLFPAPRRRSAEFDQVVRVGELARVGIAVPVNNEEEFLPACLESLRCAADGVALPVAVLVVLDSCTDRSAAVVEDFARQHPSLDLGWIEISEKCVGAARQAGMEALIARTGVGGLWLCTTDADSMVPEQWLRAQLAHAAVGARVVVGTVTVRDWSERSDAVRARAVAEYAKSHHRHIHGANLGFAGDAFARVGGFAPVSSGEDVQLVHALEAAGEAIAWAVDAPVTTSARRHSRAPQGFAGYLDALERPVRGALTTPQHDPERNSCASDNDNADVDVEAWG